MTTLKYRKIKWNSVLLKNAFETGFMYKINGNVSDDMQNEINAINTRTKIRDKMNLIVKYGLELEFANTQNKIFFNNLCLVDSLMPLMLGEALKAVGFGYATSITDIVTYLSHKDPCNFNSNNHSFYECKFKRLLIGIVHGMSVTDIWNGDINKHKGCIILRDDKQVFCYNLYNRNEFEDYLLKNTRLETASTTKHDFATVYKENGEYYMKLNLQIRFI